MLKRDEKDRPDWIALKQLVNKTVRTNQNNKNSNNYM